MPHLSKGDRAADVSANEARRRKEVALAGLRELQLRQAESKLLSASEVEQAWAGAVIKLRNAVLAIPSRCAPQFTDPRHAAIIRGQVDIVLKQLRGRA